MAFQQANGLTVDGIIGPQTTAALQKVASGVITPTEKKTTTTPTPPVTTKASDDPSNQFNTATGAPNPNWINPATGKTTQGEITNINTDANAEMEKLLAGFKGTLGESVDVSESSKLIKAITDSLATPPTTKTPLVDVFNTKRAELGVGAKETELASIDSEIAKLDQQILDQFGTEDDRLVSMTQIGRRKTEEQRLYEKARKDLELKRTGVVNELNQKYGVIDSIMKYTSADYENAQQDYTTKFNQAISFANLIKGVEETAKSDAEKKVDNARANAQIMITTLKGKSIDYTKLDPYTLLDLVSRKFSFSLRTRFAYPTPLCQR